MEDQLDLVQECLRLYFAGKALDGGGESWASECAADIFRVARVNKVANFLSSVLNHGHAASGANDALASLLDGYKRRTFVLNARVMRDTLDVSEALVRAGIPFVVFKGPIQQKYLYDDHFAKPAGDVDVLVTWEEFLAARRVLGELGYVVSAGSRSIWWDRFLGEQHLIRAEPRRSTVDLHHRIQQPGSPSPRSSNAFIPRGQQIDLRGGKLPFIATMDIVLVSAICIAKAFFNREACAGYVCDLRAALRLLPEPELRRLELLAAEERLLATLMLGIRAADVLIGPLDITFSDRVSTVLPLLPDRDLRNMVMAPWLGSIAWPKRRTLLWELCEREPRRYIAEAGWAASAEISRRMFERGTPV